MKTSDEYLAEYVREKRPEIEGSLDYFFWKLGRQLGDVIHDVSETLGGMSGVIEATEGEVEDENE